MNAAIVAALAALIGTALYFTVRRVRHGGGCCGAHEAAPKPVRARRAHAAYARSYTLKIGGMTCENCARRVQNALNSVPGVTARVSISSRSADVRCTDDVSPDMLKDAVRGAGYTVLE